LELTESVFTENIANIIELMKSLCNLGFAISIDDFGSGYSSLKLLRDLPVDYLKLDKEFLDNGTENVREKIIIENVIQMAKRLGMKVVSEGVETAQQAEFLKRCSCDLAQGYLYAKPMPLTEFEKLMWK
jgi:EAL domain-containing protein (putative c-di-GMP-specific phosphodiesterase class I)